MSLPEALAAAVGRACGRAVVGGRPASGGSINDAWAVELEGGARAFVKTRADATPGEYATEAAGLRWLAEPGTVALPGVLAVGDDDDAAGGAGGIRYLALEWVEEGRLSADGAEALGRGLAAVHAAGAPSFGADAPMRIGPLTLCNEGSDDWPAFYAQTRLLPLLAPAVGNGLSDAGRRAVEQVCVRIDDLAGPPEPPARLHGDLWSGNILAGADGRARLVDPAAYGGHREIDLAMLTLFGAPSPRILAAYAEAAPLAPGWEDREGLWQLFPLLVHTALFGGHYGAAAERAARRYVG